MITEKSYIDKQEHQFNIKEGTNRLFVCLFVFSFEEKKYLKY
jgi:hypothetical protein